MQLISIEMKPFTSSDWRLVARSYWKLWNLSDSEDHDIAITGTSLDIHIPVILSLAMLDDLIWYNLAIARIGLLTLKMNDSSVESN